MGLNLSQFRWPSADVMIWHRQILYALMAVVLMFDLARSADRGPRPQAEWLWPVLWFDAVPSDWAVVFCSVLAGISMFVSVWKPDLLWPRISSAVGFSIYVAYDSSFGKTSPSLYAWLYVAILMTLLPRGSSSFTERMRERLVFWGAQSAILLTYCFAGFWKAWDLGYHLWRGRGLSSVHDQIAFQVLIDGRITKLGQWIAHEPRLGAGIWLVVIAFELLSIWVILRPQRIREYALVALAFHSLVIAFFGLPFLANMILLAVLGVMSPYATRSFRP